jgi:hypothetical protein
MPISYLPHRDFTPVVGGGTPPYELLEEDWILGFKHNGGWPIRFTVTDLKSMLEQAASTGWFVPLCARAIPEGETDPSTAEDMTGVKTISGAGDLAGMLALATGSADHANDYDVVTLNLGKDVTVPQPPFILRFAKSYVSDIGSSGIIYEPTAVDATGDIRNLSQTNDTGPVVIMAKNIGTAGATGGLLYRANFEKSGIPYIKDTTTWMGTTATIANAYDVTNENVFFVARQSVNASTAEPWLTIRQARHDTPSKPDSGTWWPYDAGGPTNKRYFAGQWWISEYATIPSGDTAWTTLAEDQPNYSTSAASTEYQSFRDHFNFLITAHWGLKNLKPCIIVGTSDTPPTRRPNNWLYRGEPLQPGDVYIQK